MWVLTEDGQLVNLAQADCVAVRERLLPGVLDVVAYFPVAKEYFCGLCSCDDEEHGREIIRHIADALTRGVIVYDILDALTTLHHCTRCDDWFRVRRRGGILHRVDGKAVCPDCWDDVQRQQAQTGGGAAQ